MRRTSGRIDVECRRQVDKTDMHWNHLNIPLYVLSPFGWFPFRNAKKHREGFYLSVCGFVVFLLSLVFCTASAGGIIGRRNLFPSVLVYFFGAIWALRVVFMFLCFGIACEYKFRKKMFETLSSCKTCQTKRNHVVFVAVTTLFAVLYAVGSSFSSLWWFSYLWKENLMPFVWKTYYPFLPNVETTYFVGIVSRVVDSGLIPAAMMTMVSLIGSICLFLQQEFSHCCKQLGTMITPTGDIKDWGKFADFQDKFLELSEVSSLVDKAFRHVVGLLVITTLLVIYQTDYLISAHCATVPEYTIVSICFYSIALCIVPAAYLSETVSQT